jgi:hypothetical protein
LLESFDALLGFHALPPVDELHRFIVYSKIGVQECVMLVGCLWAEKEEN